MFERSKGDITIYFNLNPELAGHILNQQFKKPGTTITFIDDKGITPYRLSALPQGDIAVARGISDVLKNRMIHPKTEAVVFTRKSLPEKSS